MINVLVANRGQADLYESAKLGESLTHVRSFSNPAAHSHESDLVSDAPGRTFNRVAGIHQSYGQRHSIRDKATERFVRDIVLAVAPVVRDGGGEGLVLIGAPRLASRLKHLLPKDLQSRVIGIIPKDLGHYSVSEIAGYLSEAHRAGELA